MDSQHGQQTFIYPVHASPEAYPSSPFNWYSVLVFCGEQSGRGEKLISWVTPTITIHGTLQPSHIFLPGAFDWAVTTLLFQTMCYIAHMDSLTSQQLTTYTISLGHLEVQVRKVQCLNKRQHNLCSYKPLVHLIWRHLYCWMKGPESHAGASLATTQALGDLPKTVDPSTPGSE
jgi:hypothetical protein